MQRPPSIEAFIEAGGDCLPGLLGVDVDVVEPGRLSASLQVRPDLMAPNGYLHAGTVVALADTCCGYGTVASLAGGATGFTTVELKANFVGTAGAGRIRCEASMVHGGRTTQVWDATVTGDDGGKPLAHFRCTQLLLYPR